MYNFVNLRKKNCAKLVHNFGKIKLDFRTESAYLDSSSEGYSSAGTNECRVSTETFTSSVLKEFFGT